MVMPAKRRNSRFARVGLTFAFVIICLAARSLLATIGVSDFAFLIGLIFIFDAIALYSRAKIFDISLKKLTILLLLTNISIMYFGYLYYT